MSPVARVDPAVSVVMPALNAARTLADALASLTAQTLTSWEAIVVDDGSEDDTASIARRLAASDARISLVPGPRRGVSAARNHAIAQARGAWLLFLDADDSIAPPHLSLLVSEGIRRADSSAVFCGWSRVDADRRRSSPELWPEMDDPFAVFARVSPFPIHACLARRHLVVAAGGFDESLQTCEDWDLWQRIARGGGRFVRVPEALAFYHMRPRSLSLQAGQMLQDGLRVIATGHSADPRVAHPIPEYRDGAPHAGVEDVRFGFASWCAALAIGSGADPAGLLEHVDGGPYPELDVSRVANALFTAILLPGCHHTDAALAVCAEHASAIRAFLAALERRTGAPAAAMRAQLRLDRNVLTAAPARQGATETTILRTIDVTKPLAPIDGGAARRLHARVLWRDEEVGFVDVAIAGLLEPLVLADAIAAALAWSILGCFLRETVYPHLTRRVSGGPFTIRRGEVLLGEWDAAEGEAALHDRIGWTVFLEEFWGRPDLPAAAFYDAEFGSARSAITMTAGLDLLHMAVRDGIIGHEDGRSLHERLGSHRDAVVEAAAAKLDVAQDDDRGEAARFDRHHFERLFASASDPWRYGNDYERVKYEQTLSLLPEGPIEKALEIGCAEGRFTVRLAPRVQQLTATDISSIALERARERCAGLSGLRFERTDLVRDALPREQTLIVCSELLYYVGSVETLRKVVAKLTDALAPGGVLISAHARVAIDEPDGCGFDWDVPFGSYTIVDTLAHTAGLRVERMVESDLYRIICARKAEGAAYGPEVTTEHVPSGELPPDVAVHVRLKADPATADIPIATTTAKLPILMYHRVSASGAPRTASYRVPPSMLDEQLSYLRDAGFRSVTLDRWLTALRNKRPLPGRAVALTFDDGYEDFGGEAWPLLQRYGFSATLFVVSGRAGSHNDWDAVLGERVPLMGWSALRELAAAGVVLGSHSVTHRPLTSLSTADLFEELTASRTQIEDRAGAPVTALAYPYGDADGAVQDAARRTGYAVAVTTRSGSSRLTDRPWTLPRIEVSPMDTLQHFVLRL